MKVRFNNAVNVAVFQSLPCFGVATSGTNPDAQNYNRYSYCMNNPLMYTDPSGYKWKIFKKIGNAVCAAAKAVASVATTVGKAVVSAAVDVAAITTGVPLALAATAVSSVVGVGQVIFSGGKNWTILKNDVKIARGLCNGSPGQILSRFTWELPQTIVGYVASQGFNMIGDVKDVYYFHGATVVNHYSSLGGAFTIGSYINAGNGSTNQDIMHEYGHYLQSHSVGPSYLFNYALPSLVNARETPQGNNEHNAFWVEQDADIRARNYFGDSNWNYDAYQILGDPHNPDYTNKYANWYNYMGPSLFKKLYKWLNTAKN